MFASAQKTAASSLDALRRKIELQMLAGLQPLLLLQMLGGLSQAVSHSVSHTQALARTLLLSGQQQLRALLPTAPRLRLPLERTLTSSHSGSANPTPEEAAAQALLEVCLGLMLEWIARKSRRPRFSTLPLPYNRRQVLPAYSPSSSAFCPLRARLCITIPLA
jgi:hypothetical protein